MYIEEAFLFERRQAAAIGLMSQYRWTPGLTTELMPGLGAGE
jgi:hypothetical protein